jgi:photosystem II stability/assembly factor-like uncharacterized protein
MNLMAVCFGSLILGGSMKAHSRLINTLTSVLNPLILGLIAFLLAVPMILHAQPGQSQDDLFSVTFPNENEGWTSGRYGTILHTSDGGKTWSRQETGTEYTLSAIHFVDSKNGWAVGEEGTIIHTNDGGKTWGKQKSPVNLFLMDVYFLTPTKGFIAGERTHILSTNDGGKTWKIQFKDLDYILKAISFCDAKNGWVVGEFGYIYRTRDGGDTWEQQAGFSDLSEETGELIGGTYLFDVIAINPLTVWAVGIDGYVAKTIDGGKTWQQVHVKGLKAPFFSISSDRQNAFVIGGTGHCFSSIDGGKTWRAIEFKPPIKYSWIYGIVWRKGSSFIAVGKESAIYHSTSGAWEKIVF